MRLSPGPGAPSTDVVVEDRADTPRRPALPRVARRPILAAMVAVAAALTIASPAYGYHRDELYFRMLPLKWGYVDQPPLTPLLARMFSAIADETWAMHIPATFLMSMSVLVVALITRELGGDRRAQILCAWAYATSLLPLEFARVLLTATVDLVVWPAVILFTMRAILRNKPQWWLAVGLLIGLSMYNKLLIALLLVGLAVGMAVVGPRKVFRSPWVWAGVGIALVVGAPNLIYQATHDWPQLTMGRALAEHNASEVRLLTFPILLVMFGLPLVPIWVAGIVGLLRRPSWRPVRYVAAALPVVLGLVFVGGSQSYYPLGLMTAFLAAGSVIAVRWMAAGPPSRTWAVVAAVAFNAVTSVLIALPVVPPDTVGATPIPTVNQLAQDQVGWPTYVRQIASVRDTLPASEVDDSVVITDNYGEAGAVARYGPDYGMTRVYSAQNELYFMARPPASATTAIIVGTSTRSLAKLFDSCRVGGSLDNGLGVDNQEQDVPISICRGPVGGWRAVWPAMQHYD